MQSKQMFFFIFCFFLPILLFSQTETAKKGVLDLRNEKNLQDKVIALDGEWEFHYQGFLNNIELNNKTKKSYRNVPSNSWNDELWEGEKITAFGFATYRLKVLLPIKFPFKLAIRSYEQSSAYILYIDGQKVMEQGKLGKNSIDTQAGTGSHLENFVLTNANNEIEIIIHISNFEHRKGGLWHSLFLGEEKKIHQVQDNEVLLDVFLLGSLLMMAFYHLLLFVLRPKDFSVLYFSICCLIFLIRLSVTGEVFLEKMLPSLSWEFKYKLEYGSLYCSIMFLALFMSSIFPKEYAKKFINIVVVSNLFFTSLVLVFDVVVYSHTLIYFYIFTLCVIVFSFYAIVKSIINQRKGAFIFLVGVCILYAGAINDILFSSLIVNTFYALPICFLLFFFSQATLLALRSADAFKKVEILSSELITTNQGLEKAVEIRNQELSNTNANLKQVIEELHVNLETINTQQKEIYQKNKDLIDSLEYAKRIQTAILPNLTQIEQKLNDFFIYYEPKDIVSGDFYYFTSIENKIILAAVDCTGHGVPGAFMSLIGKELLDKIILEKNIIQPNLILNELHIEIRKTLKQETTDNRDGMDISLVCIDNDKKIMTFAGAKNPIYFIQNQQWHEIKGDAYPIGGVQREIKREFSLHTIDIQSDTTFYLFSDGFQDQFGGELGKKYLTKNFKLLLQNQQEKPLTEQKTNLQRTMKNWRTNQHESNDDILVIGVKLDKKIVTI
ncbi:MAG: hypothetical protein EAZ85_10545 [Bacteroidetes bacterium]|nr:MAG: hypothetical protein EAZ85_10545 [Bacteroidota bacterium]TAG88441.1 MAG: hypothetical protein EAZ20_08565 [Bacteroidota bacterium]